MARTEPIKPWEVSALTRKLDEYGVFPVGLELTHSGAFGEAERECLRYVTDTLELDHDDLLRLGSFIANEFQIEESTNVIFQLMRFILLLPNGAHLTAEERIGVVQNVARLTIPKYLSTGMDQPGPMPTDGRADTLLVWVRKHLSECHQIRPIQEVLRDHGFASGNIKITSKWDEPTDEAIANLIDFSAEWEKHRPK